MSLSYRRAVPSDFSHIRYINERCLFENYPPLVWERLLSREVDRGNYVACDGHMIVGYILLSTYKAGYLEGVDKDCYTITSLAVLPEYRQRGIAQTLIGMAVNRISEANKRQLPSEGHRTVIRLYVRLSNVIARKLYSGMGFKDVRIAKNYYDNPVEDAVVMELF